MPGWLIVVIVLLLGGLCWVGCQKKCKPKGP